MEINNEPNFKFETPGQGTACCLLKIFKNQTTGKTIVMVSQEANAKGFNLVTGVTSLANEIREKYVIIPEKMVLIEHFPGTEGYGEAFDLVSLQWEGNSFKSPQRKRILREMAEELAGCVLSSVKSST